MADELEEASSPLTSPQRLSELARSKLPGVRRAVASNPSAPLDSAAELCAEFPAEFLANPSLQLWCLENPSLLVQLPSASARALVDAPETTTAQREQLASHPRIEVRFALARSSLVTAELLERLGRQKPPDYRLNQHLTENPLTPVRMLEDLRESLYNNSSLLQHPHTPAYLVRDLALQAEPFKRMWALRSPLLPRAMLPASERGGTPAELEQLALNTSTSQHALRRLARNASPAVRAAAARNPQTSIVSRIMLLADKNPSVRKAALESTTPRPT